MGCSLCSEVVGSSHGENDGLSLGSPVDTQYPNFSEGSAIEYNVDQKVGAGEGLGVGFTK